MSDQIRFSPVQPYVGAEVVGVDLSQPQTADAIAQLRAGWLKYKVLIFRDQNITRGQQLQFGKAFGVPERHPAFGEQDIPEVLAIREQPGKTMGEWHTDVTYVEAPPSGALLHAIELPKIGGDTIFVNTAAAYEKLDDDTKRRIASLQAEHAPGFERNFNIIKDAERVRALTQANPPHQHPVVTVHPETGEKVLFVNEYFTTRIVGLEEAESERLLAHLFTHIKRPEYQLRVQWELHTVVFWDERATQHYAVMDYSEPRRLDRVTLSGTRPRGLEAVKSDRAASATA